MQEIEKKIVLGLTIGYYLLWMLINLIFYLKPPKKINGLYGYRTLRSMKNPENWHLANKLAPKYMFISNQVTFGIALLYFFLFKNKLSFTATFLPINFLFCFSLICIIPLVERKLKRFEEKRSWLFPLKTLPFWAGNPYQKHSSNSSPETAFASSKLTVFLKSD